MELEFVCNKYFWELDRYAEQIPGDGTLCIVCQVDEREDGKNWERYAMRCGHKAHTRCLRAWCTKKDCVNCPLCGNLDNIPHNRFCQYCNTFEHSEGGCPVRQEIHEISLGLKKDTCIYKVQNQVKPVDVSDPPKLSKNVKRKIRQAQKLITESNNGILVN